MQKQIRVNIKYIDSKKYLHSSFNNFSDLIDELYYKLAELDKPSIELSEYTEIIPMYDIYTENIILVKRNEVYDKLLMFHYRPITNETIKLITNKKSLQFLTNYDIDTLQHTFYKLIYDIGKNTDELTNCLRPSFLPVIRSTTPYYTKTELIYLALNMNLWIDSNDTTQSHSLSDICNLVIKNDITSQSLLKHQVYIKETHADNYIKYYSFLGSQSFNYYLRYPKLNNRDFRLEHHIKNFRNILINSPGWDKSYYLYRWIQNDDYIKKLNLKVGDTWTDYGFLSTTRQPFIDSDTNYFGYVLLKVKVPKGVKGSGLSIEFYSHFPEEQEIVFPPSNYKLVSHENVKYFHPDEYVSEKVTVKYEFEWISFLNDDFLQATGNERFIPTLDISTFKPKNFDLGINLKYFSETFEKEFMCKIGNENIVFTVNKILNETNNNPYHNMFYTNNITDIRRSEIKDKEIFLCWQNDVSGDINLLIEISTIISVNYYFKFSGMETKIIGDYTYDDIIMFIANLAKFFNIDKVIINSDYKRFSDIIDINIKNPHSYHDVQLYISDTNYFNQCLHHYINLIYSNNDYTSSFSKYIFDNVNIKGVGYEIIAKVMAISIDEFIQITNKNIINESYIDLIFKIAKKIKNKGKIIDLYMYIVLHYNYLIPYLHAFINDEYGINLVNVIFLLEWKNMLHIDEESKYTMPMQSMNIPSVNSIKLKRAQIIQKKYQLLT